MNYLKSKSRWLAAGLALAFLAGLTNSPAAEQDKKEKSKEQLDKPTARPAWPTIDAAKPTTEPKARLDRPTPSPDSPPPRSAKPTTPSDKQPRQPTTRPDGPIASPDKTKPRPLGPRPEPVKSPPAVALATKPTASGGYIKTTPS